MQTINILFLLILMSITVKRSVHGPQPQFARTALGGFVLGMFCAIWSSNGNDFFSQASHFFFHAGIWVGIAMLWVEMIWKYQSKKQS